jgi:hypothetical protein
MPYTFEARRGKVKAKETKKCLHRDVDDDDLVEFCQL